MCPRLLLSFAPSLLLLADDEEPTDLNTIVFSLVVKCDRSKQKQRPGERDINKLYENTQGSSFRVGLS